MSARVFRHDSSIQRRAANMREDFDTGATIPSKYATNSQLAKRQLQLILPLLTRTDKRYLESLESLLAAGLGNRKL